MLNKEDIIQALHILSKNDMGKNILRDCQTADFDVSEIQIISPDGKRNARCFRQLDNTNAKDVVSVNQNLFQDGVYTDLKTQDEKHQMLANLMAHELTHAIQYGHNPDLIPTEGAKLQNTTSLQDNTKQDIISELSFEALMEADCRAVQFAMALKDQSPAILNILEKQHMPEKGIPILDEHKYKIWKLKHRSDSNKDISAHQQAFCEIFSNILGSYIDVYEKHILPKHGITSKIDFNGKEKLLSNFYDEKKFGSPRQFADNIPNLNKKNKAKLVASILLHKKLQSNSHSIKISSSDGNAIFNNSSKPRPIRNFAIDNGFSNRKLKGSK